MDILTSAAPIKPSTTPIPAAIVTRWHARLGAIWHSLIERVHECRMDDGARDVLLVTIGAALGTLAALGVTHFIAAQLFGVTPRDPTAIVGALSVLGCVMLIAGYLPARNASRIDPVKARRTE
jgi:ABC-type antimicrobial peptide transport system permease subunit